MRRIGFIVGYITLEGPNARVGGRCAYESIRIGDVFTEAVTTVPATEEADYAVEPSIKDRKVVTCRVETITAYRRPLKELDRGMTAELVVSGEGLSRVAVDDILTNGDGGRVNPVT